MSAIEALFLLFCVAITIVIIESIRRPLDRIDMDRLEGEDRETFFHLPLEEEPH